MDNVKQAQSIVGYSKGRPENDFYITPPEVTKALLEVEQFPSSIWECACGDGAISEVLMDDDPFRNVFSTDLVDRGYLMMAQTADFLKSGEPLPFEIMNFEYAIITNPPFKLVSEFISHAVFDLKCKKLALFAKLALLEGQKRSKLLEETKLTKVHVFRNRVLLTRNGEKKRSSGMIAFAWGVWEKGYTGKPTIDWIETR